jgi:hypothetical protein
MDQKTKNQFDIKNIYNYTVEIVKPQGVIDDTLSWCKEQIAGDWKWDLIDFSTSRQPGKYAFYFVKERDYLAFTIKWL